MLNTLFSGIFSSTAETIAVSQFLLCIVVSLLIGALIAAAYCYKSQYTKSFVVTLGMLPAVVCVVIMMVNGNVGAGVAVAGAFSLVRFRSVPGTAKEIGTIFLAMGAGLIAGMGYLGYAVLFSVILCFVMFLCNHFGIGEKKSSENERLLVVTVPEDLNYVTMFDDLFEAYTEGAKEVSAKTTNMGSLFKLSYELVLKDTKKEKEFMDAIRCRNGNLEVRISRKPGNGIEL